MQLPGSREQASPTDSRPSEGAEPWLILQAGSGCFALPAASVNEVVAPTELTGVPRAPAYLRGLMNLRGDPLPLVQLSTLLGLSSASEGKADGLGERVLVVVRGDDKVGFTCNKVFGVLELKEGERRKTSLMQMGRLAELCVGEVDTRFGVAGLIEPSFLLDAARPRALS